MSIGSEKFHFEDSKLVSFHAKNEHIRKKFSHFLNFLNLLNFILADVPIYTAGSFCLTNFIQLSSSHKITNFAY